MIDNAYDIIVKPVFGYLWEHMPFISGVIINVVLIMIINKILDALEIKIVNNLKDKRSDSPLLNMAPVLTRVLKAVIVFMLLAGFLQSFGYNVSSLIAGFGITGLAVGFAAKEAIGNFFGSFGLMSDRVFKIGDYIKFDGMEGYVENINLRSTSIRTLDSFVINVPNNSVANEAITNVSKAKKRKIDIIVGVEYSTSNEKLEKAIEILKDIAKNDPKILGNGMFTSIESLGDSSINIRLFSYTSELSWAKYKVIKGNILKEIIRRFREEGIEFAFPSTSVYMHE